MVKILLKGKRKYLRYLLLHMVIISFFLFFHDIPVLGQKLYERYIDVNNPGDTYIAFNWNTDNGLPQNSINGIVQTEDNYIWLATNEGLLKFDGYKFINYNNSNTPELESNRINAIFLDSKKRMWLYLESKGIVLYQDNKFSNVELPGIHHFQYVSEFKEDSQGNIWLGTNTGLLCMNETGARLFGSESGLDVNYAISMLPDRDGTIIVGCSGVVYLVSAQQGVIRRKEVNKAFSELYRLKDGKILAGTLSGLYYLEPDDDFNTSLIPGTEKLSIYSLFEDDDGIYWIGTGWQGLYFYSNGKVYSYSDSEMQSTVIRFFSFDSEANIWVGTNSDGLFRFRKRSIFPMSEANGLSHNVVYPIAENARHEVLIGVNCGPLNLVTKNGIENLLGPVMESYNSCTWSLFIDSSQNLFYGTYGGGLYKIVDGKIEMEELDEEGKVLVIFTITEDSRKRLWVGGINGLVVKQGEKVKVFTENEGLSNSDVKCLLNDREDGMWVGTSHGLNHFDKKDSLRQYPLKNGQHIKFIRSLFLDDENLLWIGTYGDGLYRYDGKKFFHFATEDGLFDNVVSTIVQDDYNNLWFTCNKGLYYVRKSDLNDYIEGKIASFSPVVFGKEDGLLSTEFNGGMTPSSLKHTDGTLWFPSIHGAAVVDPEKMNLNLSRPNIFIEKVFVDDTEYEYPDIVEIPPGSGKVKIVYTSLSFKSPENVTFQYKLEGLSDQWSNLIKRREIIYEHLPPGSFEFRTRGCNSDGIWNYEGSSVKLIVHAYFYQTVLFYIIVSIIFVMLVATVFYIRIRSLQYREKKLQELVEERTINLKQEKEKTESALAEVQKSKEQIEEQNIELEILNSEKDKFFSLISHDLKSPFVTILGYSEMLFNDFHNFTDEEKLEHVNQLNSASQKAYYLVENLLLWASSERGLIELKPVYFSISESIRRVVDLLAPVAARKSIQLKSECSDTTTVFADKNTIETVLRNLINNAIKFSYENGIIEVTCNFVEGYAEISVRDTGIGMDDEKVLQLLEGRKNQISDGTYREKGTGLGLQLCREFISRNNGTFKIESKKGEGSLFVFTIPL